MAQRTGRLNDEPEEEGIAPVSPGEMKSVPLSEWLMMKRKYSIFWPTSKTDLLLQYPALKKDESFIRLKPRQMLFVWFFANRTSPLVQNVPDETIRIKYALGEAYHPKPVPDDILKAYSNHKWGGEVAQAINSMRAFMPDARIRLRLLLESNIDRVQMLLEGDVSNLTTWKQRAEFFNAVEAGNRLIAEMLPLVEKDALGVVDITGEKEWGEGEARARTIIENRGTSDDDDEDDL